MTATAQNHQTQVERLGPKPPKTIPERGFDTFKGLLQEYRARAAEHQRCVDDAQRLDQQDIVQENREFVGYWTWMATKLHAWLLVEAAEQQAAKPKGPVGK